MPGEISVSRAGDAPKRFTPGTFDPASEVATGTVFDKVTAKRASGKYENLNADLLFNSTMMAQNEFSFYDKDKDGVLSPAEVKPSEDSSNGAYNYMNTETAKDGKTTYKDTDFASFTLNYYDKYNK